MKAIPFQLLKKRRYYNDSSNFKKQIVKIKLEN